jgi:hypothetical protein
LTRKRALIATGIATAAIFVVLAILDLRMSDTGGPGIIGFEFAGTEDGAGEILDDWGDEGKDAARASLWIDFAYIVVYSTFGVLAVAATRDLAARRGWRRMAAFGSTAIVFPAAAGAFDAIEDVGLLLALDGHGGDLAPGLALVCASLKFLLTAASIAFLLAGLVLRLRARETPA